MKPSRLILLAGLLMAALAVGSYFNATALIDSFNHYRSPLKDQAPADLPPASEALTRRVVWVLIDALRYDTAMNTAVMPTLASLRESGASARMTSQPPSFSQPGWTTLLTGAYPPINDGPIFNVANEDLWSFTQDEVFTAAKRAGHQTAVSGYFWFENMIPAESQDAGFFTEGEDHAADLLVLENALPWLDSGGYEFVLIHLDQVDYAGHHEGGPAGPNWNAAATRVDDMLAEIITHMDLSKDTLLVCSDHGQIDMGGHGGQDPVTLVEPFVMVGAAVQPGEYDDIQMVDVAPTISTLLGAGLPASTEGRPLIEMLTLSGDVEEAIAAAHAAQQQGLADAYTTVAYRPDEFIREFERSGNASTAIADDMAAKRGAQRIPYLIGAILVLLIPPALLSWKRIPVSPWLILSALLFSVVFHLRFAVLDARPYSVSGITSATDLVIYVVITSLIALLLALGLYTWRTRLLEKPPLQVFTGTLTLGMAVLYLLLIPVMVHVAVNGFVVTNFIHDLLISFIGLISLIQVLAVSLLAFPLGGLAALVSRLAARKG